MCTVTFIPVEDKFIITSNRDEHISRPYSCEPKETFINGCKLIFPKDPKAGGTWFAINENGFVGVLLNGAFQKHKTTNNYAMSRGLILLNIMSSIVPSICLNKIKLDNIEPFTLVLFEDNKLFEFRWDGEQKHYTELNKNISHIWSSVTLYTNIIVTQRKTLFTNFINQNKKIESNNIIDFHSYNNDDYQNGFIINRESGLKTFSITQAVLNKDKIVLSHSDLLNNKKYSLPISINSMINQLQ